MKNWIMALFALGTLPLSAIAQSYEGTAEYDKKKQGAIIMDYAYSTDAVELAIVQKMERMGYKAKEEKGMFNKDKGFRVYKGAIISDISSNSMDYYIDIERKSRKEKDVACIYLIINKNGQNIMDDSTDPDAVAKAKDFLNGLIPDVEASNLELQIKAQEELITKTDKKLKGLRDDQDDLEKKLKNNQRDQESTAKDIENQKAALENLRAKRKT